MALRDEIRRERQAVLKNGTFKDKCQYFIDYYGKITLGVALALIFLISMIYNAVTKPETVLSAIFLNVYNYGSDYTPRNLGDDFAKSQVLDTSEYEVAINEALSYPVNADDAETEYSAYETSQVIMTQAAAKTLDIIVGPTAALHDMSYSDLFVDLSTVLTEEQMNKYEEYMLYMDRDVIVQRNKLFDEMGDATSIEIPTSMEPEGMVDPIPVMLDLSHCTKVTDAYAYNIGSVALGVVSNAPNIEMIQAFVDYVME